MPNMFRVLCSRECKNHVSDSTGKFFKSCHRQDDFDAFMATQSKNSIVAYGFRKDAKYFVTCPFMDLIPE